MILKLNFARICAFRWTKVEPCFKRLFFHFTIFGFKNEKNQLFEEIKRFESSFYRIDVQVITNPSIRLEKHQTIDFLLMTDFLFVFII